MTKLSWGLNKKEIRNCDLYLNLRSKLARWGDVSRAVECGRGHFSDLSSLESPPA